MTQDTWDELRDEAARQARHAQEIFDQVSRFIAPKGTRFAVAIRPGYRVVAGIAHKWITNLYEVEMFTPRTLKGLSIAALGMILELRGISDVKGTK